MQRQSGVLGFYCFNRIRVDFPLSLQWLLHFYFSMGRKGQKYRRSPPYRAQSLSRLSCHSQYRVNKTRNTYAKNPGDVWNINSTGWFGLILYIVGIFFDFILKCLIWLTAHSPIHRRHIFNFRNVQSLLYANHVNVISLKTSAPRLNHNTLIQYQRKKMFGIVCLLHMKICPKPDARGRGEAENTLKVSFDTCCIFLFVLPLCYIL